MRQAELGDRQRTLAQLAQATLGGVQADIALIARTIAKYEPVYVCANSGSAAN